MTWPPLMGREKVKKNFFLFPSVCLCSFFLSRHCSTISRGKGATSILIPFWVHRSHLFSLEIKWENKISNGKRSSKHAGFHGMGRGQIGHENWAHENTGRRGREVINNPFFPFLPAADIMYVRWYMLGFEAAATPGTRFDKAWENRARKRLPCEQN